ncbi:MAG: hypothetical protein ABL957_04075 [Parvularculaceae bacterium]
MEPELVLPIAQTVATAVIGLAATGIAFMQADTNRKKYKLDRYDRRFDVYEATLNFLSECKNSGFAGEAAFHRAKPHAPFLFGPEIESYLSEIIEKWVAFLEASAQYRDNTQPAPPDYDHQDVVRRQFEAASWLAKQIPEATRLFRRYLDVGG